MPLETTEAIPELTVSERVCAAACAFLERSGYSLLETRNISGEHEWIIARDGEDSDLLHFFYVSYKCASDGEEDFPETDETELRTLFESELVKWAIENPTETNGRVQCGTISFALLNDHKALLRLGKNVLR